MDMWSGPETYELLRNSSKIGLFDSGVGGLSVLKELQGFAASTGKNTEFVYVGDTARCPYGNRNAEEIRLFVEEIVLWLNQQKVDAVIMACNTSAALALPYAKLASTVPVIDLIGPTANYVAGVATRIGVMATATTVRSRAFARAIAALNPEAEVTEIGCPDLVPIIESGNIDAPGTEQVLLKYVDAMKAAKVEAIILGCTHFPFLRKHIQHLVQDEITIIDPAESLTSESKGVLKKFISETATGVESQVLSQDLSYNTQFFVTGNLDQFNLAASKCLAQQVKATNTLSLTDLAAVHSGNLSTQAIAAAIAANAVNAVSVSAVNSVSHQAGQVVAS